MKRILFLSQTLPYPPNGGVFIRTYNILRQLSQQFELTIHSFDRTGGAAQNRSHEEISSYCAEMEQLGEFELTSVPQGQNRLRLFADHGRSMLSGKSAVHYRYASRAFGTRLQTLLASGNWDIVHVDSLDLVTWLPSIENEVIACTHHNVESDLLRQRSSITSNPLLRSYLMHQADLTVRDEQRWCPRVATNVVVSDDDGVRLSKISPSARFDTIPNGVDTSFMTPGGSVDGSLVFVGSAGWFPNKDGFEYFCDEILPLIRSAGHDPTVTWIGRAPEPMRREFRKRYAVHLTGYMDDIRPTVRRASCFVMPIRVGGGSRLKLLDAWSMGKAVVSTSAGAAGVEAIHDANILISDGPDEFARSVIRILEDSETRLRLGEAARETAERLYSWEVVGNSLCELYSELAAGDRETLAHHQIRV